MNRNLDGSPITVEQHLAIAEAAGLDMIGLRNALIGVHNANMILSDLSFATRAMRFQMWTEGKLTLASPRPTTPAPLDINVDQEVLDFLVSTMKEPA